MQGVRHGMQNLGAQSLNELNKKRVYRCLRGEMRSVGAQREGNVHDIIEYNERNNELSE